MRLPSDQNLAELEAAVRSRVGFDPQSVGDQSLLRAVRQHMTKGRVSDGDDYIAHLLKDDAEFEAFVEELVVPETWFFRDRQPFRCIQYFATQCWRPSLLGDRLRILSIPCSTGEEPYSIAMALLDVGLTPTQFHIDGADLSRHALRQAEHGGYGRSSFRGDEAAFPDLRDRFLQRQKDAFVANAQLRGTVRFFQANLISASLLADQPEYHVIFCRNVLIYLDPDARRTALANLHRLLSSAGLLYVGHVEARVAAEGAFRRFNAEFPFAFSPAGHDHRAEAAHQSFPIATSSTSDKTRAAGIAVAAGLSTRNTPTAPPNRIVSSDAAPRIAADGAPAADNASVKVKPKEMEASSTLAAAGSAANAGRLDEATRLCQEILACEPTSVSAICLLGLVSKARGKKGEAERFFQKALYLEPRHKEALVHMMLLAQERGDEESAANFRRRVEQV
jgi:chemotaxis protein methyltransferase WspC